MEFISPSDQATIEISTVFAAHLMPGDVIGMIGPLGAGKTTFINGLLHALDYRGPVTSPTYTLMHEYTARIPVFHLDCFRLLTDSDFISLGWDDFLRDDAIVVVEWADRISAYFDRWVWRISLDFIEENDHARRIAFWCNDADRLQRFRLSLDNKVELK
jgi:tRNA threonylcarbamoyladenosine biosynthesis protein TsaE